MTSVDPHRHLVVMGVAASGKTTVADLMAARCGWSQAEADDFHPAANVEKMSSGVPLTDEDRWPWLRAIRDWMAKEDAAGHDTIVTCSALKRAYRDLLREAPGRVQFVHLHGTDEVLRDRIEHREGHFMTAKMLDSQLAALEPLGADEDGFVVDIDKSPDAIADEALARLGLTD